MKKIFTLLAAAVMLITAIAGCSPKETPKEEPKQPALADVQKAVKEAYGENYLPSMPMEEKALKEIVKLNMGNVEEFIAEAPMISMHPDTFIAIKAKQGKGEQVKADLDKYKNYLINESLQYPSNLAKVNNTTVVAYGDYVFLVMLGAINENMDSSEEAANKFAAEQVKIGLDAIDKMFK